MNARQILAQGAIAVLHPEEFGLNIEFRMALYLKSKDATYEDEAEHINMCGTSCCYAGHIVLLAGMQGNENYKSPNRRSWADCFIKIIESAGGVELSDDCYSFLTGAVWNNDRYQCAERVRIYLEEGAPNAFSFYDLYPVRKDTEKVLREIYEKG